MAEHTQVQSPGRRRTDDPSTSVVPLRTYLEQKIDVTRTELKGEIAVLRAEAMAAQAQATREHTEVQRQLCDLSESVQQLTNAELRDQGAEQLRRAMWKAVAALIAAMASICAIAGFLIAMLT